MAAKYELLRRISYQKPASVFRFSVGELVVLNDPTNDHEVARGLVEMQVLKNGAPVYQIAGLRGLYSETYLEATSSGLGECPT